MADSKVLLLFTGHGGSWHLRFDSHGCAKAAPAWFHGAEADEVKSRRPPCICLSAALANVIGSQQSTKADFDKDQNDASFQSWIEKKEVSNAKNQASPPMEAAKLPT
jgi:hypothetical protein